MLDAMSEPSSGGDDFGSKDRAVPPPSGDQPSFPPSGDQPSYPPPPPPPPPGSPYPPGFGDPAAPFGRHPVTGEPLSDKSKTTAGLLQLLGLISVVGIGRIYIGQTNLGVVQLVVGGLCGILLSPLTCGISYAVPVLWGIIDCVILLSGTSRDAMGRVLRDGF
nr:MAG: hypothetical protein DIU75_20030 [Mycolicibacterium hassiacum]